MSDHSEYKTFLGQASVWYHGSPQRLEALQEGSTVTPVLELAEAFSHKPSRVGWTVTDYDGERWIRVDHNGERHGFLHRVVVEDPAADLRQHPTSVCAPGEEMLTNRDLRLEFIRQLPLSAVKAVCFCPRGNGLTVRSATLDEVPGIGEVHSDGGDPWADAAQCPIWVNHRLLRGFTIDVAVLDARVVGHAEWQVSDEPAPYGRHLYLSMLEIHPEFRGRGIGREMIEARAATAKSLQCSAIRTIPDKGVEGFYAKLGFSVGGQVTRLSCPPRDTDLPAGWKRCGRIPHSVVKTLPMRFGWYQACSEFVWENYERPIVIAGDDMRHLRARRLDGKAFVNVGCHVSERSADPAVWASPEADPAELVQAAFALGSRLPADRISFAVDSAYAPEVAPFIGAESTETGDIVSRIVA